MLCPDCASALRIGYSETVVSGDESALTDTEVTLLQHLICQNPTCPRHNKEVHIARVRLYPQ